MIQVQILLPRLSEQLGGEVLRPCISQMGIFHFPNVVMPTGPELPSVGAWKTSRQCTPLMA